MEDHAEKQQKTDHFLFTLDQTNQWNDGNKCVWENSLYSIHKMAEHKLSLNRQFSVYQAIVAAF